MSDRRLFTSRFSNHSYFWMNGLSMVSIGGARARQLEPSICGQNQSIFVRPAVIFGKMCRYGFTQHCVLSTQTSGTGARRN